MYTGIYATMDYSVGEIRICITLCIAQACKSKFKNARTNLLAQHMRIARWRMSRYGRGRKHQKRYLMNKNVKLRGEDK